MWLSLPTLTFLAPAYSLFPLRPQEDSADLKCQLHFAKEESALMCKKLTKLAKENDGMKEELLKYRSLYGDLDGALSAEELADAPHSRETELKVHLKLVEEEANLLSRRIVELEVENRGLRAEMDDMKDHGGGGGCGGPEARLAFSALGGGECGESLVELRRHLQFVEEEAELLRRSSAELEDQNKLLLSELAKYRSEHELDVTLSEDSCSVLSEPSQEELAAAKLQIGELSGKVKKLQYENRVLLSNLQRCDLASCQSTRPMLETDAEAGDSAQCVPASLAEAPGPAAARLCRAREAEALPGLREQAVLVSKAIDVLVADANGFSAGLRPYLDNECADFRLHEAPDNNSEGPRDTKLMHALLVRLSLLQQELNAFTRKADSVLGGPVKEPPEPFSTLPALSSQGPSKEILLAKDLGSDFQVRRPRQGPYCFFFSPGRTVQQAKLLQSEIEPTPPAMDACEVLTTGCAVLSRFSHARPSATPWSVAHQAPLSLGFSRQEYWSRLPRPPPGHLPSPGIELASLKSPALAGWFFTTSTTGKPLNHWTTWELPYYFLYICVYTHTHTHTHIYKPFTEPYRTETHTKHKCAA